MNRTNIFNGGPVAPHARGRLDPVLEWRDGNGNFLTSNDDGGSGIAPGPSSNAFISDFLLPSKGTFEIIAQVFEWFGRGNRVVGGHTLTFLSSGKAQLTLRPGSEVYDYSEAVNDVKPPGVTP